MEVKSSQFDTTDPFAGLAQRIQRAQAALRHLPPAERQQLLEPMLPPVAAHPRLTAKPTGRMATVQLAQWDGDTAAQQVLPPIVFRPRRVLRTMSWPLQLRLQVLRWRRRIAARWQRNLKRIKREMRALVRQRRRSL